MRLSTAYDCHLYADELTGLDYGEFCELQTFDMIAVPFSLGALNSFSSRDTGKIPEFLLDILRARGQEFSEIYRVHKLRMKDCLYTKCCWNRNNSIHLTEPLKISVRVPSGGLEWLKLKVVDNRRRLDEGCGTYFEDYARVVLYYNTDHLVTQEISLPMMGLVRKR